MTPIAEESETLVLQRLKPGYTVMLDQMVEDIPALSWNQIFQTVDALSRKGVISLRRRGFSYELSCLQQRSVG